MNKGHSHLYQKLAECKCVQYLRSLTVTKKSGLTLIEVIISMALLGIMALSVTTLVNGSIMMNKQAELKQGATKIGQQIIEATYGSRSHHLVIGETKATDLFPDTITKDDTIKLVQSTVSEALGEEADKIIEQFMGM